MSKIYRIREKRTGKFIKAGYNQKMTWLKYPSSTIENSPHIFKGREKDYEIVVFEYKEIEVLELKEL